MGMIAELRAARTNDAGEFIPLDESGETLFQLFSVPGHGLPGDDSGDGERIRAAHSDPAVRRRAHRGHPGRRRFSRATIPRTRTTTASAAAPPASSTSRRTTPRLGRFGWKAQHATLLAFSGDAYRNEMGITNDLFPKELAVGVTADQMRACDPFPDPEDRPIRATRRRGIDNFPASCSSSRRSRAAGDRRRDRRRRAGVRAGRMRRLPRAGVRDGIERESPLPSQDRGGILGFPAARHRHRRWHQAGGSDAGRDSHARPLGPAVPPSAPARRIGGDDRAGDPASCQRGGGQRGSSSRSSATPTAPR